MAARGSQGHFEADFFGALLNDHEHDIGGSNSADYQGEKTYNPQKNLKSFEEWLEIGQAFVRIPDKKSLIVFGIEFIFFAEVFEQLFFDRRGFIRIGHLVNKIARILAVEYRFKGARRDEHLIRIPTAIRRILLFMLQHADYQKRRTLDRDIFANRICPFSKKIVPDVRPQKGHSLAVFKIDIIKKTPARFGNKVAHNAEFGVGPDQIL